MNEAAKYFQDDSVDKQIKIEYDGGSIGNEEIESENFELTERLCSESELRFGSCEASTLTLRIHNVVSPLEGKWLTVTDCLENNSLPPYAIGVYKVDSDKVTADRLFRDITAYDAMYDIINSDVADWYNTMLPNEDSNITLKEFRTSFISHFGLEQEEIELVNDDMVVEKTVEPSEISGKDVITAICEVNGCFGHIGRDGRFRYIHLKEMVEGLYPRNDLYPRDDLYPADPMNAELIGTGCYIPDGTDYEDFTTARINKLQIRKEENDVGTTYPPGDITESDNCYIVQDNVLLYGKTEEELQTVAANLYEVIHKIWYRPASVEAMGNPCLEVGDGIRLVTKYEIIYTYILQRTLKGIQALRDTYEAEGEQYQTEKVNSVHTSIVQLKGKTNTLTRTVEETNSRITDVEAGLSTRITQNAKDIILEAQRATEAEGNLSAAIKVNADSITAEVTRATEAEGDLSTKLSATAEGLQAEISRASNAEGELSTKLSATAEGLSAEVRRASEAEGTLSAQVSLQAQQIQAKVSKDSLIAEINLAPGTATITAARIDLNGLVNAQEFKSAYASISSLEAVAARVGSIEAKYVSADELNAVEARIESIEADYASVSELDALNADISGRLKAQEAEIDGKLSANEFEAWLAQSTHTFSNNVIVQNLLTAGYLVLAGEDIGFYTINGVRVLAVRDDYGARAAALTAETIGAAE